MASKASKHTCLSSSGKVEYVITNYVALLEKQSVPEDFHALIDFFKISPVSYALTANPTIYAEIVQEMWSSACCFEAQIKLQIKGKLYVITPSVINEALRLPNSNFGNLPTNDELFSMLNFIKSSVKSGNLCDITRTCFRKEWFYFFDTIAKVFSSRYNGYSYNTKFVLYIAYSLMYGKTIDIGSLLFEKLSSTLGRRGPKIRVIYYARFLMIIANHLCTELSIHDPDYTLQPCVQTVSSFCNLVDKKFNAEVEFVLPPHIQAQLSTLSPSHSQITSSPLHGTKDFIPSAKATLPSQSLSGKEATTSVYGKSKKPVGTGEENEEATEVNPPKKKMETSVVKPETGLFDVDPEMPSGSSRNGVLALDLPFSTKEDIPQDRQQSQHLVNQHFVNTASIIKSQLVAYLVSSAEKLSPSDMIDLADRSYSALRAFGDDYTSFRREVDKLIAHRQALEYAAKEKEKNDEDIDARYIQQKMSLSDMKIKSVGTQGKLSRSEANLESLKLKREELTAVLLKLTEELSEEEKRVKTLAAERDQCKKAYSDVKAVLRKLDAKKEEARVAFEAINDKYNAAKDEFERMNYQLLHLVGK